MCEFPDSWPSDFRTNILPKECEYTPKEGYKGYRVAKWGATDSRSYLGSHDEAEIIPALQGRLSDIRDAKRYSTSFWDSIERARYFLKVTMRHDPPKPEIIVGYTDSSCGPSLADKPDKKGAVHINWWIFKNAKPWLHFERIEE